MKIKKLRMANALLADILACNGFHAQGYATLKSDAPDDLKVIGVFHSDAAGTTFTVESESFADVEFIHDAPLITFSITAENYVENLRQELEAVVADRDELLKRAELVAGWNEITVGLGETVKEMKAYTDELTAERDALKAAPYETIATCAAIAHAEGFEHEAQIVFGWLGPRGIKLPRR